MIPAWVIPKALPVLNTFASDHDADVRTAAINRFSIRLAVKQWLLWGSSVIRRRFRR